MRWFHKPAKAEKEQPPQQKPAQQKPATEKEISDLFSSFWTTDQEIVRKYVPLVKKLSLPASELKSLIQDYADKFGDPSAYVAYALPKLLEKTTSAEQLKKWHKELIPLIKDYRGRFGSPYCYVKSALPKLLEKTTSIEQLKEWNKELIPLIQDHKDKSGDPLYYVNAMLPKLLEKTTSIEQLKELRLLIQDYSDKFGDYHRYIVYALPALLGKTTSIEQLKEWDRELKPLIKDYQAEFGDPKAYVGDALPKLLEKTTSIEQLKEWNRELIPLIQDYKDKFGNPLNYVAYALPELLEKTTSIEQLLKTQLTLFNAGIGDAQLIPFFTEMLETGKLKEGELRLTRLHLTSAVLNEVDPTELTGPLAAHEKIHPNLNLVEDFLLSQLKLEKAHEEKLTRAFSSERTDVRRALLSRGLFCAYNERSAIPSLQLLLKHEAGKSLPEAMEFFPSLLQMQKDEVLSEEEADSILISGNSAEKAGILLSAKVEATFGVKVKSEEGKAALKDPDFVLDLLTFNSSYKQVPEAHKILKALAKAYFEEGTEGVKKYKFSHDLAGKQAPKELHAKLKRLDKFVVKSETGTAKPFDAFTTTLKDYQDHRRQQGFEVKKIVDAEAEEAKLTQLKNEVNSPEFRAALERRDEEAIKETKFSGNDEKRRGRAIGILKTLKGIEAMERGEELVEEIGRIGALPEAEQAAALLRLKAERQAELKETADILQIVGKELQRKGKPEPSQVVAEMQSLLTELSRYEEKKGAAAEVSAGISFDFGKGLKIGRHGTSGQGNCQRSTYAVSMSQSLMSFLGDSNELQIFFRSGDEEVGFMQFHGATTEDGQFVFILELNKPYTNKTELASSMKDAAERLAKKISAELGITVYDPYSTDENVSITFPQSTVSRYLDFVANSKEANEFEWSGNVRRM